MSDVVLNLKHILGAPGQAHYVDEQTIMAYVVKRESFAVADAAHVMVSERHAKFDLVHMTTYLLGRIVELEAAQAVALENAQRLGNALVYVAHALHGTPQHMLAEGITLIDGNAVRVKRDGCVVEATYQPSSGEVRHERN